MSNSSDFDSENQKYIFHKRIEALLPCRERRRVAVGLKLSKAAKSEPLRSSALQSLREIILREKTFADVDPVPSEVAVFEPPVGLVISGAEITVRSLGWGKLSYVNGVLSGCGAHGCAANAFGQPVETQEDQIPTPFCTANICGADACQLLNCGLNSCSEQLCGVLDCGSQNHVTTIVDDLQAEISHPFVEELIEFVGSGNLREVTEEVLAYAAFGAADTSLLTIRER